MDGKEETTKRYWSKHQKFATTNGDRDRRSRDRAERRRQNRISPSQPDSAVPVEE